MAFDRLARHQPISRLTDSVPMKTGPVIVRSIDRQATDPTATDRLQTIAADQE